MPSVLVDRNISYVLFKTIFNKNISFLLIKVAKIRCR